MRRYIFRINIFRQSTENSNRLEFHSLSLSLINFPRRREIRFHCSSLGSSLELIQESIPVNFGTSLHRWISYSIIKYTAAIHFIGALIFPLRFPSFKSNDFSSPSLFSEGEEYNGQSQPGPQKSHE